MVIGRFDPEDPDFLIDVARQLEGSLGEYLRNQFGIDFLKKCVLARLLAHPKPPLWLFSPCIQCDYLMNAVLGVKRSKLSSFPVLGLYDL